MGGGMRNSKMEKQSQFHHFLIFGSFESQKEYDRAILFSSCFGLFYSFIAEVVGVSCIFWVSTIVILLASLFLSTLAFNNELNEENEATYKLKAKLFDNLIKWLNHIAGIFFILGLIAFLWRIL